MMDEHRYSLSYAAARGFQEMAKLLLARDDIDVNLEDGDRLVDKDMEHW